MNAFLLSSAIALAALCGWFGCNAVLGWRQARLHRLSISQVGEGAAAGVLDCNSPKSLNGHVVAYMEKLHRRISLKQTRGIWPKILPSQAGLGRQIKLAGMSGRIDERSVNEAKARLALIAASLGFAVGLLFSVELAFVLAILGAVIGFQAPTRALKSLVVERAHETERHLSEMLDVIALGMRSGLSFDASMAIYSEHFDTTLAKDLESSRRQWSSGLARREDALRELASTYDSAVFTRVVETVIRSIRLGSSMVSSLEDDAREARSAFQTSREERIAKAPVKMMVPTGVLILPAMLILVLGPVLLELMEGGL